MSKQLILGILIRFLASFKKEAEFLIKKKNNQTQNYDNLEIRLSPQQFPLLASNFTLCCTLLYSLTCRCSLIRVPDTATSVPRRGTIKLEYKTKS